MRLAWGFFLIYAGIALISKTSFYKKGCHFYFNKKNNQYSNNDDQFFYNFNSNNSNINSSSYQTTFSNQTIDLQSLAGMNGSEVVHVKTVFGTSHIYIDSNMPTQIITHTTFSNVIFPDRSSTHSGSFTYLTHNMQPKLILYVTTVFGTTIIKEK